MFRALLHRLIGLAWSSFRTAISRIKFDSVKTLTLLKLFYIAFLNFPFRAEDPPPYVAFKTLSFDELIKNLAQIEEEDQNDWLQFSSKKQKHGRTFSAMK